MSPRRRLQCFAAILVVGLLAVAVSWFSRPSSRFATLNVDEGVLPQDFAGNQACEKCHADIPLAQFLETGHAQSLHRAIDVELAQKLDGHVQTDPHLGSKLHYAATDTDFSVRTDHFADGRPLELQWLFGAGTQARTWVTPMVGHLGATELLEYRWTWYRDSEGLDVTPGQPEVTPDVGTGSVGRLFDAKAARNCFGCHTTVLPVSEGRIDFAAMVPGVGCEACHGPGARHVREGRSTPSRPSIRSLKRFPAREQIDVCGRCHRTEKDLPADSFNPTNKVLARFQTAGFPQSPCFQKSADSESPFVCTTCHDPHRPTVDLREKSLNACRSCHVGSHSKECPVEPAGDRCLDCHMPKVRTTPHLAFADHWIRKRNPAADNDKEK